MSNNVVNDFTVTLDVEEVMNSTAKSLVNAIKAGSPKNTGKYKSGWTHKMEDKKAVVYNATSGQLTHLLENGHMTRNGQSRVPPQPHIRPAYERIVPKYIADMKAVNIKVEGK